MIEIFKSTQKQLDRYYKSYHEYMNFSEEENRKFDEINQHFVFLQNYLRDGMLHIANIFNEINQKEFPYLKGFRVIGTILAFKDDPRLMSGFVGTLTPEETQMYDKWKEFHCNNVWRLEYDAKIKDFTPLSKVLLSSTKFDHWRHTTFDICSFLGFYINQSENVTYKDLLDFDFSKDLFFTDISVYVNETQDSIYNFNDSEQVRAERKTLSERSYYFNKQFKWTQKNIKSFFKLNNFCKKKYNYMIKELQKLNKKLLKICNKEKIEYNYSTARLHYKNTTRQTSITEPLILKMIEKQLNEEIEESLQIDGFNRFVVPDDDISLNWNYEEYAEYLTEEQKSFRFNSYMRRDLIDNDIFSFEDIIRMKEEDFCICWGFNFFQTIPFFGTRRL